MREIETDVLIVGGGCGGVAAALALLRAGVRCAMTEPTRWIGGQLTSQGVPPDENPWVEGGGPGAPASFVGANASYAEFRRRVRAHYRERESLTARAVADERLDPGGGWVSRLCMSPMVGERVLRGMLTEADGGRGLLTLLTETEPVGVESAGDLVREVRVVHAGEGMTVRAGLVLDATELGDLLELAGVESVVGAESRAVYGELHGREDLQPGVMIDELDQQACSWCFAVEHRPGEDHRVARPASYEFWRGYVPTMSPGWPGPLFSWLIPTHNTEGKRELGLVPWPDEPERGRAELWRYRRIVDASVHTDGRADVSLFNVVQMDYWQKPLLGVTAEARRAALAGARDQSLAFLYWMQNDAPRHDGGAGYPGLRLRGAELGTSDGFAMAAYIREPRRLLARTMLTEAHVGAAQRTAEGRANTGPQGYVSGEPFADSVAIGHYPIDLHPSCAGRNSVYVPACPFRVPLGALVPRRVRNVLAAGKALGVSHVANGSTRLHPVEWAIGEAAGELAAFCVAGATEAHAVCDSSVLTAELRQRLARAGVPLEWPWER